MNLEELYLVNTLGSRNSARARAMNLEDIYGVKPKDIEEYRSENGGIGFFKSLAAGLASVAVAAAIGVFVIGASAAMPVAGAIGSVVMTVSMVAQNEKVMRGYEAYLGDVSAKVRSSQGIVRARPVVEYNNAEPERSFVQTVQSGRNQGTTRERV